MPTDAITDFASMGYNVVQHCYELEWTMITVVSAILTNNDGQVLLQQRDGNPELFPYHWTLPGGHVEAGESPAEAMARELFEENELSLPLDFWKVYDAPRAGGFVEQYVYIGRLDREAGSLPVHEGLRVGFFPADEIGGLDMAFDHRSLLDEFFNQRSTP
ncbi:MAG: NUDIX domain-containing protein [Anaerolineae bacterium]|nr:NUDIX domain-containing protein [Anaerolineae bacterium]